MSRPPLPQYTRLAASSSSSSSSSSRRLSIRPRTFHPANPPTSLFRLRGRRTKALAGFLAGFLFVSVVWIATSPTATDRRSPLSSSATRDFRDFKNEGGFGKDFMGRDEPSREGDEDDQNGTRRGGAKGSSSSSDDDKEDEPTRLDPERIEGGLSRLCLLFPWRSECLDQLEASKDPFRWYDYSFDRGRIEYPARAKPFEQIKGGRLANRPPGQPHPIHYLVKDAKDQWSRKLKRQSKTLPQAIDEYEARYGRRPPRGFDEWFYHALAHEFVLRDEFDIVDQFVTPYLAIKPSEIKKRHDKMQFDEDFWLQDKTFTIELRDRGAHLSVRGPMNSTNPRPTQMLKLLENISHNLPNMNITFTGHDQPWIVLSGEARAKHVAAARSGKVLSEEESLDPMNDWTLDGWANACPIGAPLRNLDRFDTRLEEKRIYSPKPVESFIVNHTEVMDLCQNPEGQMLHGFTSWIGPRPGSLYPIFSSTTTSMHSDFLIPPVDQYDYRLGEDPEWEDKLFDKVVWRGSTTGADLNVEHARRWSQRVRLCRLPFETGSKTLPYAPSDSPTSFGPLSQFTAPSQPLARQYFDFAFLGEPTQCDDPQVCKEFEKQFLWDDFMEPETQNEYKYVIDVDGNGWSGRFHR
ncbi:hypothetical protein JCM10212_000269 [Sporobolomyces blumeae]